MQTREVSAKHGRKPKPVVVARYGVRRELWGNVNDAGERVQERVATEATGPLRWQPVGVRRTVIDVAVDWDALAQFLAARALGSKSGRTRVQDGIIEARVIESKEVAP